MVTLLFFNSIDCVETQSEGCGGLNYDEINNKPMNCDMYISNNLDNIFIYTMTDVEINLWCIIIKIKSII